MKFQGPRGLAPNNPGPSPTFINTAVAAKPSSAHFLLVMATLSTPSTFDSFATLVQAGAAAVVKDGGDARPQQLAGIMEESVTDLKRLLPGSLLKMKDKSWAVVPIRYAVADSAAGVTVSVQSDGGPTKKHGTPGCQT